MNELSLFTGCGGGILASTLVGIHPVCGVEINEYARNIVLMRQNEGHLPPFPIFENVKEFDGRRWEGLVDIISGGYPCQAFSSASRGRKVAEDLWPEMLRIVREVAPWYVFAENVSKNAIEHAGRDLAGLGYKVQGISLSAKDLGSDHVRRRYWLLAYADDKSKLQCTIYAEMEKLQKSYQSVWAENPRNGRMVNGMAHRMDRFRCIGNGQVPIVAATALITLAFSD